MFFCDLCIYSAIVIVFVLLYYSLRFLWELIPISNLSKKAVFISGCDTGFGYLLAIKLARNGITTFAGCLTKEGQEKLNQKRQSLGILEELLVTLPLDVRKDDSVKNAAEFVKKNLPSDKVLWALVNNAGIFSCYGPDAWTPVDDYWRSLDVNLFGVIRCVHSFLPLLKQSKGRIISIASVAGRMSFPCGAPYNIAKYGVEAYMDAIRFEVEPFGVTCSILEPGAFKTNLLDPNNMHKRVNTTWQNLSPELKAEYGENFKDRFVKNWNSILMGFGSSRFEYVVDTYYHAITAMFPRLRYRCGWDSILLFIPISMMPALIGDTIFRLLAMRNAPIPASIEKQKVQ